MTLDEIIKDKDWWYQPEETYIMDEDWVNEFKQPAPYDAFEWWDQYTYRTPRYYFRIVVREHTKERMETSRTDFHRHRFSVIVKGVESTIPLPISWWEINGTPWKHGGMMYADPFYFGYKYKDLDVLYSGKDDGGTPAALMKGFDSLGEADDFAQMWMKKAIEDHKEQLEIEKKIMELV